MEQIIWGYDETLTLPNEKAIGSKIKTIKQLFSALLFKGGVSGIALVVGRYTGNPKLKITVYVDKKLVFVKILTSPLKNKIPSQIF